MLSGDLKPDVERSVLARIALNADALIACWAGELDTVELGLRLRKLGI